MGIKGLMPVIKEHCPNAVKDMTMKGYFGRIIAIDASMCLYQFLIAVRQGGEQLSADDGEVTSHLQGMFYRTMRLLDHGIKPVYVFDGKPPQLKFDNELAKRAERRAQATEELKAAEEAGDQEEVDKIQKRLVKVSKEQNQEVQHLLTLMGIPWIEAPSEAEALCAELTKKGLVYATATEDMDALTFGTTRLLRNLLAPESRQLPVVEVNLEKVLAGLKMTYEQFVDFCILLGCDYTCTIPKVGPSTALNLIEQHGNTATIIPNLSDRYTVPENFYYKEAADLFINAEVGDVDGLKLEWKMPSEEGLIDFLVTKKGFAEDRVRTGVKRIQASRKHLTQQRLENFFKPAQPAAVAVVTKKVVQKVVDSDGEESLLSNNTTTTTTTTTTVVAKKEIKNPAKIAKEKRLAEEAAKKKEEAAKKRKATAEAKKANVKKQKTNFIASDDEDF